jgi:hypothetical protein
LTVGVHSHARSSSRARRSHASAVAADPAGPEVAGDLSQAARLDAEQSEVMHGDVPLAGGERPYGSVQRRDEGPGDRFVGDVVFAGYVIDRYSEDGLWQAGWGRGNYGASSGRFVVARAERPLV